MAMVMAGVTGAMIVVIRNGVAITIGMAMGIGVTDLDNSNPIPTPNLSMSHRQYTIRHSNRPASIWFFRLIFIDRYHLIKRSSKCHKSDDMNTQPLLLKQLQDFGVELSGSSSYKTDCLTEVRVVAIV